jgi:uncharacterized protein
MPTDLIRYDLLVQDALKSVVRNVLADAARDGLRGDHHFCVTFRTHAPGVRLTARLREKHPEEMTIILQHQFWDLVVTEQAFEVGLSFGNVPERLTVPFEAVTGFWDPSVQFGLKFEVQDDNAQAGANDAAPLPPLEEDEEVKTPAKSVPARSAPGKSTENGPRQSAPAEALGKARAPKPAAAGKASAAEKEKNEKNDEAPAASTDGADKVVSIDAFRKKT